MDGGGTHQCSRARARLDYADAIFDEALDIASNPQDDIVWLEDKQGRKYPQIQHRVIQRDRLHTDTIMKIASKINPAKYGERLEKLGVDKDVLGPLLVLPPAGHA